GVLLLWRGRPKRYRHGRRLCPTCRYDLSGSPGPPCPECGYAWSKEADITHRPSAHRLKLAGILALVLAAASAIGALANMRHWTHYVPEPVLSWMLDVAAPEASR